MQYLPLIFPCLLLLWLVYAHHNDNSLLASLSKQMIRWIVLTLVLAQFLSMLAKKQASASEPVELEPLEVLSVAETRTIQELFHSIKCFKVRHDPALKAVCEMVPPPCTIQSGIWKLKISWC